jgi:Family of unknown function (DUF6184)
LEENVNIRLLTGIGGTTLGALVLAAGCSHSPAPHPAETALTAPIATFDTHSAASSIAEARCAREDRCTNVGKDKKFSSVQDCLTRVRNDWKDDLNARQCPGGANETQLNECLDAIRHEDCSSPFDTLSRLSECTAGQICID